MVSAAGAALIENDIYSELACGRGEVTRLGRSTRMVIQLASFSKIAFPGIRVGWINRGLPRIVRATELKQLADLHTDHLSQAFLRLLPARPNRGSYPRHREYRIAG